MTERSASFALPDRLEPDLARVRDYWDSLKRGQAEMPFWDDVKISALPELAPQLLLFDVFEHPLRFRFAHVGRVAAERYGGTVLGKFAEEIAAQPPFDAIEAQCMETVATRRPTHYRYGAGGDGYARLLLPMWGDGHISMLLGAVA